MWVPDKINSTVQALGNGSAFRKHHVDMDFFQHKYKNTFPSLCNYMLTNPSSTDPPAYTPHKRKKETAGHFYT